MCEIKKLIDQFLSTCKHEKNLSPHSVKAYSIDLNQFYCFIQRNMSHSRITDLDKQTIRNYLTALLQKNKPKTVKRKIATLKAFMNHLEYEDIINTNPFRKLRLKIKEGKQLPRTIDLKYIKKLFNYIYAQKEKRGNFNNGSYKILVRDIAVIEMLFATGMRVSELSNLKLKNINLSKGEVLVQGKGNRERIIPIPNNETLNVLYTHYELNKDKIINESYFFLNRLNNRLSEQSIRLMIRNYIKKLHFNQHITPHMFRHSVATLLLENGVDIRYIQNILGHSSINTTQIYVQVNEAPKRRILRLKHPRGKLSF